MDREMKYQTNQWSPMDTHVYDSNTLVNKSVYEYRLTKRTEDILDVILARFDSLMKEERKQELEEINALPDEKLRDRILAKQRLMGLVCFIDNNWNVHKRSSKSDKLREAREAYEKSTPD